MPHPIIEGDEDSGFLASINIDCFWEGRTLAVGRCNILNGDGTIVNQCEGTFDLEQKYY